VLVEAAVSVLVEAAVAVLVGPGRNGDRRRWGCWLSRVITGALAELVEAALVEAVVPMLIEAAVGRSSGREQGRPAAVGVPVFARARAGRVLGGFFARSTRGQRGWWAAHRRRAFRDVLRDELSLAES
jgi:hypothetical protein